jgi:ADP-heptose:LPS heptosyltransferase
VQKAVRLDTIIRKIVALLLLTEAQSMHNNPRIAYIIPARLGDAIMATPPLALLKQYNPETPIDVIALNTLGASVFAHNPHIDKIHIINEYPNLAKLDNHYQRCIIAHKDRKTMAAAQIMKDISANPIEIIAIEEADKKQPQAKQALTFIHRIHDNRINASDIGYQLFPQENDTQAMITALNEQLGDYQQYHLIGCHLGCHGIAKKNRLRTLFKKKRHPKVWPLKYFIALEKQLQMQDPTIRFVITGGESEKNLADLFMKKSNNAVNLVAKTSVLQLAALMPLLRAYVASDTGAMHVGCAMQTPLVAIFGPTNARRTGPYPTTDFRAIVAADPMTKISPRTVGNALKTVWQ